MASVVETLAALHEGQTPRIPAIVHSLHAHGLAYMSSREQNGNPVYALTYIGHLVLGAYQQGQRDGARG